MSLKDLATLLELAQTSDLGSRKMLDTYQRQRHPDIKLRVSGVDALNRASIAGSPLVQDLRVVGIKALYGATPIRKQLMKLGLGAG